MKKVPHPKILLEPHADDWKAAGRQISSGTPAMVYDKAKWHSDGDFPKNAPPENGGTHIGIFLAWAINHDMASDELIADAGDSIPAVKERRMTGRTFLFRYLDGVLGEGDLNERGNAFARHYYKKYMGEYDRLARRKLPTAYHVAGPTPIRLAGDPGLLEWDVLLRVIQEEPDLHRALALWTEIRWCGFGHQISWWLLSDAVPTDTARWKLPARSRFREGCATTARPQAAGRRRRHIRAL
ncbi:MAG TPA: hypothetical protein VK797_24150 [Tepidisphaeraceae bacterium]|jgi:hypothetical protein|nr:hypothetical protein [Tepidisphaeraceae bacterium]